MTTRCSQQEFQPSGRRMARRQCTHEAGHTDPHAFGGWCLVDGPVAVEILVAEYAKAHGARPRGWGMWGFCPAERWNDGLDYLPHVMWHTGTYAQAAKSARAYFGPRGLRRVIVCP